MLSLESVEDSILELEHRDTSFAVCEKLAWLYIVRDHLKGGTDEQPAPERRAATEGDSEFLRAVKYKPTAAVMVVLNEFMDGLKVVNPSMYNALIGKLNEL